MCVLGVGVRVRVCLRDSMFLHNTLSELKHFVRGDFVRKGFCRGFHRRVALRLVVPFKCIFPHWSIVELL